MKLRVALKASATGYARRWDAQRGVWIYRTRNMEFAEVNGYLAPTVRVGGGDDWEVADLETAPTVASIL